ncbi:hypothetical protein PLEOSDRAFT_172017 [Pleurotus ostreatus PC15]|uniref:Uncharacterized protein n=1 Tax=Pleurotus ostreatus (strain PC15) TaxID=1137138 RepID=A0A067N6W9_PLEO1|nr:hypothetical protein PLEOSDRAFT_172017 [Pleurotus ostreatus PC15]
MPNAKFQIPDSDSRFRRRRRRRRRLSGIWSIGYSDIRISRHRKKRKSGKAKDRDRGRAGLTCDIRKADGGMEMEGRGWGVIAGKRGGERDQCMQDADADADACGPDLETRMYTLVGSNRRWLVLPTRREWRVAQDIWLGYMARLRLIEPAPRVTGSGGQPLPRSAEPPALPCSAHLPTYLHAKYRKKLGDFERRVGIRVLGYWGEEEREREG